MNNKFLEKQLKKPANSQTKEHEPFNFKMHKLYNVSDIANLVDKFDKEWKIDTIRQEMFPVHKNTFSYFIYDHTTNWVVGDEYKAVLVSGLTNLVSLIDPIIKDLEEIHNGRVAKVLLIKLSKGQDVLPHRDNFDYANSVRRHHIPIITNELVSFTVEQESIRMLAGECWEINNSKVHSADNQSDIPRVHLLIDIFPNKYFKEFGKSK